MALPSKRSQNNSRPFSKHFKIISEAPSAENFYLFDGRTGVADSWFYSSPSDSIGPAWSKFYLNGVQITIDSANGLSNTTLFERNKWLHVYLELSMIGTGDIHIFSRYNNVELLTGNVSQVQIYNRVLSQQEISQNFNATRGRYGI